MADTAPLEARLEELLDRETFTPPDEFIDDPVVADESVYERADEDYEAFWAEQAEALKWQEKYEQVLDWSDPPFAKWFVGGKLNVAENCVDRHVEDGNGDRVAFHWRGEEGEEEDITYADLHRDVQKFANALKDLGVQKGDVVGIFLPMVPEVVVAMLACARIGAPHNVVFGGFSIESVKERMEVSDAKVLVTVDGARRKGKTAAVKSEVDEVMGDLESLESIVVVKRTGEDAEMKDGRDHWYHDLLEAADDDCPAEPMDAEDPLFILYSSGSTAKPKGIVHTTGGYLTGVAYTHKVVFDLKPEEDVFWCSADVGWITGHSYIVYGPLANGCTSVMYEGPPDYPDKDIWWELVDRYDVSLFYTAPTAIRACMKWGKEYPEKHDLSSLRLLGTVGEPINPKAWLWYHTVIGGERCPIVDTWWQTETGHIMIAPLPALTETKPGSATKPLPGIDAAILDEESGDDVRHRPGAAGPAPAVARDAANALPGRRALHRDLLGNQFGKDTYAVGDAARKDEDGYFWIIGRTDDVLNVSGHRMSTAEIEDAIVSHDEVAEAAVIGQSDEDSGQAVTAFVTLAWRPERRRRRPRRRRSPSTSPRRSASSPDPSASSGPTTCPRPAPARSCGACCVTSPRATSWATSRPSDDPASVEKLEEKVSEPSRTGTADSARGSGTRRSPATLAVLVRPRR